jgi:hypothetical protein
MFCVKTALLQKLRRIIKKYLKGELVSQVNLILSILSQDN